MTRNRLYILALVLATFAGPHVLSAQGAEPVPAPQPDGTLIINFKGAPIDTVLDYLSKTAGYIIVKDTPISGTVDIVSHQPIQPQDAVRLLHGILNDRGYGMIQDDRILRIIKRDNAKAELLPVKSGNDPEQVPRTSELVTQIVPMRYTEAGKLIDTLKPLLPTSTVITSNESSNALVITDTQASIKRLMEIIRALDTAVSSILEVAVIPLSYADSAETAEVINKVFEQPTARTQNNNNGRQAPWFRRGRGGGDQQPEDDNEAKQTANHVKAVADERGNAVVVTASTEILDQIKDLVRELDQPSESITTLRVFQLRYASSTDIANLLSSLYKEGSSGTNNSTNNNNGGQTSGGRGSFWRNMMQRAQQQQQQQSGSQRKLSDTQVTAVADTRTNSVIVSASVNTMELISAIITELDATPVNIPTVHVYTLDNADIERTKEILESMFDDLESSSSSSSSSNTSSRRTSNSNSARNTATQNNSGTRQNTNR